jgi:hypothetical protein
MFDSLGIEDSVDKIDSDEIRCLLRVITSSRMRKENRSRSLTS